MKPAQRLPRWMCSHVLSSGQKPPQSGPALLQHPHPQPPTPHICSLYLGPLGTVTEPGFLLRSPTWAEYTGKSLNQLLKWIPPHLNTQKLYVLSLLKKKKRRGEGDFPRGPAAKTPSSQCRRPGFNPWAGN